MKLKKYANNPILKPNPANQWEERRVLNPAVIYDEENEQFVMLYRAAGNDVRHQIKLGLATSKDGINFVRQSDKPAFEGSHEEPDGGCVEDPRLMKIGDMYYLTYAARAYAPGQYWLVEYIEGVSKAPTYMDETDVCGEELPAFAKNNITVTYLAATKDFKVYKKFGRITEATVDDFSSEVQKRRGKDAFHLDFVWRRPYRIRQARTSHDGRTVVGMSAYGRRYATD